MHIHILGICGTFMAGIARIAKAKGHKVTGADKKVYPPMSQQLESLGIHLHEGYDSTSLKPKPDLVIMGNAMKRGMPAVEYVLDEKIDYVSGPEWLYQNVLKHKKVIALSGTHGKTTTSTMVLSILERAGLYPSFLIGGVPSEFNASARLTDSDYFIIEADEYDTAFFDKRAKFIHYHPAICVINNLEFDHADIFDCLKDIEKQFGHMIRTMPSHAVILAKANNEAIERVLKANAHSQVEYVDRDWQAHIEKEDGSLFSISYKGQSVSIAWSLIGKHNVENALASVAASFHAGVDLKTAAKALSQFKNVKRRLEVKGVVKGCTVYDDFAHHPTAIATTLNGIRAHVGDEKIAVCLELASFTMREGYHAAKLESALTKADEVYLLKPQGFDVGSHLSSHFKGKGAVYNTVDDIINSIVAESEAKHIVVMSNRGFSGIHEKLLKVLKAK